MRTAANGVHAQHRRIAREEESSAPRRIRASESSAGPLAAYEKRGRGEGRREEMVDRERERNKKNEAILSTN